MLYTRLHRSGESLSLKIISATSLSSILRSLKFEGLRVVIAENMINSIHVPLHRHTQGGTWAQIPGEPDGIWTLREFHADVWVWMVWWNLILLDCPSLTWSAPVPFIKLSYCLLSAFSSHGNPWPFLPWPRDLPVYRVHLQDSICSYWLLGRALLIYHVCLYPYPELFLISGLDSAVNFINKKRQRHSY